MKEQIKKFVSNIKSLYNGRCLKVKERTENNLQKKLDEIKSVDFVKFRKELLKQDISNFIIWIVVLSLLITILCVMFG